MTSTTLSPLMAQLMLVLLVAGCVALAAYSKWSLVREARGLEIHAHADGTVHEHFRGDRPHAHPTLAERHEDLLSRVFRDRV
jgi:hypothetical protein